MASEFERSVVVGSEEYFVVLAYIEEESILT
jgi:hypothetical protein